MCIQLVRKISGPLRVSTFKRSSEEFGCFDICDRRVLSHSREFNLDFETKILMKVKRNDALQFGFRTWETHEYPKLAKTDRLLWSLPTSNVQMPKFVVLVFQTDRMDNHRVNASLFDNVDLRSFKVQLNNCMIPEKDIVEDFAKNRYLYFYRNYVDFMTHYWKGEKLPEQIGRAHV